MLYVVLVAALTCAAGQTCDTTAECYMRKGVPICRCKTNGYRLIDGYRCQGILIFFQKFQVKMLMINIAES